MLDYLYKELGCRTTILGIQPACLEFGGGGVMTPEVRKTAEEVVSELEKLLSSYKGM